MITIAAIPAGLISVMWSSIYPHLERAVLRAPDEVNESIMFDELSSGETMAIAVIDGSDIIAVLTVHIVQYKTGLRVLTIPMAGGDRLDEWMELFITYCTQVAKDRDCTQLRGFAARRGWGRKVSGDWCLLNETYKLEV